MDVIGMYIAVTRKVAVIGMYRAVTRKVDIVQACTER